ncbi:AAA domain-containing protein [Desulfacinum infernum DSM 9756]|uniref:AAA domain-containing protein n=1 Tax=Desulfacinum infernum DSM 9756 TaxID=1121391 RepID=A0A1M5JB87_9BACT|nr:AAA family ATPase [Desulfacinum infernum]SHG37832.1 AAA domain-containing protein [Desulfacinum infernum DSM 9756]
MSILTQLSHWATTLPYWEQAALDKIVAGVNFTDEDYDELLQYLLEDAGLTKPKGQRPTLGFPKDADASAQPAAPVRLIKISNLQNVNALVPGQTLSFGPAMTAVYGGNGSGKSGYARVLGCAGFTRGDREVLPDVTRPIDETVALSAHIEIKDQTGNRVIHYQIGRECPELGSCYVFDSTSVRVHLTASNALSFSPAGLSYLTRLAEVTDKVRACLKARVDKCSEPHNFDALFHGDSKISEMIASLGPDTDLEALRQIAALTPEEKRRIDELDIEIARLRARDVSRQVADLKQRVEDLNLLAGRLCEIQDRLSEEIAEEIRQAVKAYLNRQTAAQRVSVDQFRSEHFTQTGSEVWYRFIEAAKALADAEQTPDAPYPQADSLCLLCQQPLSPQARDLLLRLWALLEGEAQEQLAKAQSVLEEKRNALQELDLDFFDDQSVSYRHLQEHDPAVLEKVKGFIAACYVRRGQILAALADHSTEIALSPLPESGVKDVELIAQSLRAQLDDLQEKDIAAEIVKLEQERRDLQHRALLGKHLPEIEEYVKKRIWARQAEKVGGSTRHITRKHNQLFSQLVTDRYIELFEQMLKDLGRPLKVRVATRGRKGEVYKQIVVETDPSAPADMATPDKVLSEGEKRAVALADFLTEVALDTFSSAVILDDPVTSLDLEWRGLIASILAKEAKRRQVIVFTHDLPFLYFLKQRCEQELVDIVTHWIKRGDQDDRPGYVFLNNSPALERDYRKPTRAREIYAKAKDAPAAEQEALLRDGFGALRTCYEAFIIFELLNEVVLRFDERISPGRLKDVVCDRSIVEKVVVGHERLSRYIEGHLHSDTLGAQKPTPRTLLDEIEAFEALKKELRGLRKAN